MQNVFQKIDKAASGNANVHIYGETGTGKQVAAAMIHKLSIRNDYPFITISCTVRQKKNNVCGCFEDEEWLDEKAEEHIRGYFRQAQAGTLILEDVNQMGLGLQQKLLLVIQQAASSAAKTKKWPVRSSMPRIIMTSHGDPQGFLRNGTIKPELFEYLGPVLINLKPLRDCKEDLPALANHYFNYYSNSKEKQVLPESIMRRLLDYDWPGNLYELQNTIQRYLAYDEITFLSVRAESDKVNPYADFEVLRPADQRRHTKRHKTLHPHIQHSAYQTKQDSP